MGDEHCQRGPGISRWAVKKLAGMEWPHRILFEPDLRNQGKKGVSDNPKHQAKVKI